MFGQPFLQQSQAVIDIANSVLQTSHGPVQLVQLCKPIPTAATTTTTTAELPPSLDTSVLTPEQRMRVTELLNEFGDLWRGGKRGKVTAFSHRIPLSTNRPISSRPRQWTAEEQQVIAKEVEKMLKDGVIRPSCSNYSLQPVLVMKKTGDWRFCIDFRPLNRITIADKYPLPRISDLIHSIKGSRYFVALDLRAGYWQIPMDEDSIKYTAFRCPSGFFEFVVMPFGLTNAPATFQRMMDMIFGDFRFSGILVYLDDILLHATTFEGVLELLRTTFERLQKFGLTVNIGKSVFFPKTLTYLGQRIEDGKTFPDPARVQAIRSLPKPRTLTDVRSLLGMIGYYQSFIRGYSNLLAPVFNLFAGTKNSKRLNGTAPVCWTPELQACIAKAIDILAGTVLTMPIDGDEFLLQTDTSDVAVSTILSCRHSNQDWRPVLFASKKLSNTERRWPVREREAYAIVFGLKKYQEFLRGRSFTVETDHKSLTWMLDAQAGKIARWAILMGEYPMTIRHVKGQTIAGPDFFSRFIATEGDTLEPRMTYVATLPPIEDIVSAQRGVDQPVGKGFSATNGVVYYHNALWVPPPCRTAAIEACHSISPFMHHGIKKTERILTKVFAWPGLHHDVRRYIQGCLTCQRTRPGLERFQGYFRTHPVRGVFHTIYMDFWECHYNGAKKILLTLIDQATKWVECTPVRAEDAQHATKALMTSWIYRFGVPHVLVSDRGSAFMSQLMRHLTQQLGIQAIHSTPYHPEGNATIESYHCFLKSHFTHFCCRPCPPPFEEALQLIQYAYRTTIHLTTGYSPGFMLYGVDLRPPVDNDWRFAPMEEQSRLEYLNNLRLDVQYKAYEKCMRANEARQGKRQPLAFELFQLVLVRANPHKGVHTATQGKLVPKWSLPYRVIHVYPGGKKALICSLLTGRQRDVHIQDSRVIMAPVTTMQRQDWKEHAEVECSMFDDQKRREVLEKFFDVLDHPQDENQPGKKRRRSIGAPKSGGVLECSGDGKDDLA